MNVYQAFFTLKPGAFDLEFSEKLSVYLGSLKHKGRIASWRLLRRKLGLGPDALGEFQLLIEVESLAQLDEAFGLVARRSGQIEAEHHAVNSMIDHVTFALYRDFPDPGRETGEEMF